MKYRVVRLKGSSNYYVQWRWFIFRGYVRVTAYYSRRYVRVPKTFLTKAAAEIYINWLLASDKDRGEAGEWRS